ncbi:amino acid oxidase [Paractinoplanes abujensis]|uniref:D-amino-acid oxidase n=1 Tax=Paractinoplanes abujensis TaxID=882441 RepID=A0A7W7CP86_9ACTN|nr:FAD-dependent oxidoreductase [Actinoplanes abujensis]MBB4690411.1 D-amino-acid oxidase [Actinoplanes abujensis]GID21175.1 amino acid oxidase [Actinoplanes abujensis]
MASADVVVIGSGVVGMTTALSLAEAGCSVTVLTAHRPSETTSARAGALWGPYLVSDDRVLRWSLLTLREVGSLGADAGVQFVGGYEASRIEMSPPAWLHNLPGYAVLAPERIPDGFVAGWTYSAPIFEMPVYLRYLQQRLNDLKVRTEMLTRPLRGIREAMAEADAVINCAGLGARRLVPDPEVTASWGLLVQVENPGIEPGFFSDYPEDAEPTYYIAHSDHVILGGCLLDEEPDSRQAVADMAARIRARCAAIEPRLEQARTLHQQSALRPVRSQVRLEREVHDDTVVIHNYGHGGSGVTLSWGCARDVTALLG